MSTVKKLKQNPESYSPNEKPEIVSLAEKLASNKKYQEYKDIEYRMDIIELPDEAEMCFYIPLKP